MGKIIFFTQENGGLCYRFNGELLRIDGWGENALRVRSVKMGELADTDYALLAGAAHEAQIEIKEQSAVITNGKITAKAVINPWTSKCKLSFYKEDELLLEELGECGALNLDSRQFKARIGGDYKLTVRFASDPKEKLFGMGQYQQELLDVKNCTLELAHRNSQASVPFVLSSKGYGFLWHNPAVGRVTFGKNETQWYAESTKQMDYWITAGDTPDEIEQSYAAVTGKAPMMPEYGLGFWQCKLRYWNQEQVLEVAREYHRRQLPVDVIVIDFFHWPKMGDFRFEEEFFPNPEAMVKELESYGMKLMVSVWPQIAVDSENFQEMKQQGFLAQCEHGVEVSMRFGGESLFFDATNPRARRYVWDKCRQNYYDKGIELFWLDEAEPEFEGYDFDNYRYHMGTDLQVGNIYPQLYAKTFYDGRLEAGETQIVNLLRCAWAGSQRYGALVWSGDIHSDWETLRRQVCAGINMGLAGIPWWTTDIGGFSGGVPESEDFRQLLVRWFEWGTFCPVMRLHGDRECADRKVYRKDGSEALFTGGDNEIWSFGENNTPILEKYIRLREQLRPYTRRLMQEAHELGRPVMRAMFYEFPQDEKCWELQDEYMYGDALLIAPVMYKDTFSRKVYLPKGAEWTCLLNHQSYKGGQEIIVDVALEQIAVFSRNGEMSDLSI